MKLLYLTDITQLSNISNIKLHSEEFLFITGDITVSFELIKNNIQFINEWDYLDQNNIESNWNHANNLSKAWWSCISFDISQQLMKFYKATSQDMVYSFEAIFNTVSVYSFLLEKYEIKEIHGYFLSDQPVIKTGPLPTHRSVRSISQAILKWIADNKSIPVYELVSRFPISNGLLK